MRSRRQKSIMFVLVYTVLLSHGWVKYDLLAFLKTWVIVKWHNGFFSPNSEFIWPLLVRSFLSNHNILSLKAASKSITFHD